MIEWSSFRLHGLVAFTSVAVVIGAASLGRAPGPSGACCLPGGCQAMSEGDCIAAGGLFMGPFTSCVMSTCPPGPVGACCHLAQGTCQMATQAECHWPDFVYQGHNTSCSPDPCNRVEPCPGDLTGSGSVGVADLLELLACWGDVTPGSACANADLSGSGTVGVADLLDLLANWGPCPR